MPRIFDNIEQSLLPTLRQSLQVATQADFCGGYFNLRGWRLIDSFIESWNGSASNSCCLPVRMNFSYQNEMRAQYSLTRNGDFIDQATVIRLRKKATEHFKQQLEMDAPNNQDQNGVAAFARPVAGS